LGAFFATATIAPLLTFTPTVLAVQFLQFYESAEPYGKWRTAYLRCLLPAAVRKASRIIIFSQASKADLIRWTHAREDKVRVVPHGVNEEICPVRDSPKAATYREFGKRLAGGRPYIIYVSATYYYKNHERLIRAFAKLKRKTNVPHVLVFVGSEVNVTYEYLRSVARQEGVESDFVPAGRLGSVLDVAGAYMAADLAVMPSSYETFGYPVLEAMATGCPVVTSNIGTMAELSGDAAVLVDPSDDQSIADGMEKVLLDPACRLDLIAKGNRRVSNYRWDKSVRTTLGIIEECAR
jgi:glycosyltransferase involved in cell wall biosynthesis